MPTETLKNEPMNGYRLVSRDYRQESTIVDVEGVQVGAGSLVIIAGPCAVEGREHFLQSAKEVAKAGADIIRGGAFKPRASVYSFQGLGEEGLSYLAEAREITGKPTITEATGERVAQKVAKTVSVIQIGSKNSQNYDLLRYAGQLAQEYGRAVLLKRHYAGSIHDLLNSAEYIAYEGQEGIILCLRGIRTTDNPSNGGTRYTPDFDQIPKLRTLTHLPIIADVSHPAGERELIADYALQAVAAGADGLMIESCINPKTARCDSKQMVTPEELSDIIHRCRKIHATLAEYR